MGGVKAEGTTKNTLKPGVHISVLYAYIHKLVNVHHKVQKSVFYQKKKGREKKRKRKQEKQKKKDSKGVFV